MKSLLLILLSLSLNAQSIEGLGSQVINLNDWITQPQQTIEFDRVNWLNKSTAHYSCNAVLQNHEDFSRNEAKYLDVVLEEIFKSKGENAQSLRHSRETLMDLVGLSAEHPFFKTVAYAEVTLAQNWIESADSFLLMKYGHFEVSKFLNFKNLNIHSTVLPNKSVTLNIPISYYDICAHKGVYIAKLTQCHDNADNWVQCSKRYGVHMNLNEKALGLGKATNTRRSNGRWD